MFSSSIFDNTYTDSYKIERSVIRALHHERWKSTVRKEVGRDQPFLGKPLSTTGVSYGDNCSFKGMNAA